MHIPSFYIKNSTADMHISFQMQTYLTTSAIGLLPKMISYIDAYFMQVHVQKVEAFGCIKMGLDTRIMTGL